VLLATLLRVVLHARLDEGRVEHGLLGKGVQRKFEADLVDQHAPVAASGLEVLELSLDDRVVVGDQVAMSPGRVG